MISFFTFFQDFLSTFRGFWGSWHFQGQHAKDKAKWDLSVCCFSLIRQYLIVRLLSCCGFRCSDHKCGKWYKRMWNQKGISQAVNACSERCIISNRWRGLLISPCYVFRMTFIFLSAAPDWSHAPRVGKRSQERGKTWRDVFKSLMIEVAERSDLLSGKPRGTDLSILHCAKT